MLNCTPADFHLADADHGQAQSSGVTEPLCIDWVSEQEGSGMCARYIEFNKWNNVAERHELHDANCNAMTGQTLLYRPSSSCPKLILLMGLILGGTWFSPWDFQVLLGYCSLHSAQGRSSLRSEVWNCVPLENITSTRLRGNIAKILSSPVSSIHRAPLFAAGNLQDGTG